VPQVKAKSIPGRRNRQYEKRLASINKAAARIIARDGFEGASVRRVAAKAKIGLSGIYYYYKSKEDLLYALQKHTFSTLVRLLRERLASSSTPEEKLRAVIENHFQFFVDNVDELKVCVHEIESLSGDYYKKVLEIRREYFALVKEVVREAVGRDGRHDPNLAALFLFGSLNWVYMWYDPQKNADTEKLSQQLEHIFLNGIQESRLP
jgi:AcrR family transcriptional regulator